MIARVLLAAAGVFMIPAVAVGGFNGFSLVGCIACMLAIADVLTEAED